MKSREHAVLHFSFMAEFTSALKALPAEVLGHAYSYEAFGSWSMVVRCQGVPLRIAFDGKDRRISTQRSTTPKAPYLWEAPMSEQMVDPEDRNLLGILVAAVRTGATATAPAIGQPKQ